MNVLLDENLPRSLAPQIAALGFTVQDVRDIALYLKQGKTREHHYALKMLQKLQE